MNGPATIRRSAAGRYTLTAPARHSIQLGLTGWTQGSTLRDRKGLPISTRWSTNRTDLPRHAADQYGIRIRDQRTLANVLHMKERTA